MNEADVFSDAMTPEYSRFLARVVHSREFVRAHAFEQQQRLIAECTRYRTLDEVPATLRQQLQAWAA